MIPLDVAAAVATALAADDSASPFSPAVIAAFIAACAAVGGAYLTYRSSSKANATNDKKVDLEEHRDSMNRLQAIINEQDKYSDRLRMQIDRMNNQLDSVQNQLAREMDVSQVLKNQVATLQDQVRVLQRMIDEKTPRRAAADRAALQSQPPASS